MDYELNSEEDTAREKPLLKNIFCANCEVNFDSEDAHKSHYRSDFHQYNLKRRMLKLAPIALDVYEKNKAEILARVKNASNASRSYDCGLCHKSFACKSTHDQHLLTKKHRAAVNNPPSSEKKKRPEFVSPLDDSSVCLFCNHKSESFPACMKHMSSEHSFFIVREEECADKERLVAALAKTVVQKKKCIYCSCEFNRVFPHPTDAQQHMRDKGHCMMNPNFLQKYLKFYKAPKGVRTVRVEPEKQEESDSEWEVIIDKEEGGPSLKLLATGELLLPS